MKDTMNNNQSSLIDNQLEMPSTSVENVRQISLFYAKQTQSQVGQNKRKLSENNVLCKFGRLVIQTNKAKTNPIQSQFKPNLSKGQN